MIHNPASLLVDVMGRPLNTDPFGNLQVAQQFTVADLTSKYDVDAREYASQTSGGGAVSHLATHSAIKLAVGGTNGDVARSRTHTYFKYQAGKSTTVIHSVFHSDAGQANQNRHWGLFDDQDGVYWALHGTTMNVAMRSSTSGSPVDTLVPQSQWNVDKMDGNGPSGVTLDITKGNIYEIQLEWLGVGYVRFFINQILVHEMRHPNTIAGAYMRTAVLPLQMEIINTGASSAGWMARICGTVHVDGGGYPPSWSYGVAVAAESVTASEGVLMTIRPKLTYNGITNRMLILPKSLFLATKSNALIIWRLVMNATLTNPSWTSASATSGVEYDSSATISGGETLMSGFLNSPSRIDLSDFFSFLGRKLRNNAFATANAQDNLTVLAASDTGTASVRSGFSWDEIR